MNKFNVKQFLVIFTIVVLAFASCKPKEEPKPKPPVETFEFIITANDVEVKNGETFIFNEGADMGFVDPQIRITKTVDEPITAMLTVKNDESSVNATVLFCGWQGTGGQCVSLDAGKTQSFTQTVSNNNPQNPFIDINITNMDLNYNAKVIITLTYNDKTQTVYWVCKK